MTSSLRRFAGPGLSVAALAVAAALTAVVQAGAAPSTETPSPSSGASAYAADELGFLDSAARCDRAQTLMAFGRTARSLVAICVDPSGQLEYRGERLSDGASLRIAAGRSSDGSIVATNDGVTYAVSPTMFLVSEGDTVLYRDSWTEFHQPRFSPGSSTTTGSSAVPSPATSPTVSTTTVTPPPKSG